MTRYRLDYEPKARKQLRAIRDRRILVALEREIAALADDPRPPGCRKLEGRDNEWRVRVGTWRVIYQIEEDRVVVLVVRVAPRGEVYW